MKIVDMIWESPIYSVWLAFPLKPPVCKLARTVVLCTIHSKRSDVRPLLVLASVPQCASGSGQITP